LIAGRPTNRIVVADGFADRLLSHRCPPAVEIAATRLSAPGRAYAAARLAGHPLPATPYFGDPAIAVHLLITKVALFQPELPAGLWVMLGLADGREWRATVAARLTGADLLKLRAAIERLRDPCVALAAMAMATATVWTG
jgi:hypothetical protein